VGVSKLLTPECGASCWDYLAVDRVSFGFVLYHSLLMLVTFGVKSQEDFRASIHNGWWFIKIFLWAAPIVGAFFIDNSVFETYWIASFIFAFLFIIVQSILLVRCAFVLILMIEGRLCLVRVNLS
jgi:hypothetical protein